MTTRLTLPNRRETENVNFKVNNRKFILGIGRFDNGSIAEIFINTPMKAGSEADVNAKDGAIAVSLALQYGCPLKTLQGAMNRNADGSPQGPLGAALDAVRGI